MHILDKLSYLIANHKNFYWTKADMEGESIQLGHSCESHIVFEYKEEIDTAYLYRTIYTRFDQSISKSAWPFSPPHNGQNIIKELIFLIKDKVDNGDFENRDDKLELMNSTNNYINQNFQI